MEAESYQNSWFTQILKYAEKGDVAGFNSRLKDEPDLLEDMAAATRTTVMHAAAENGHFHFVTEILKIKPRLAEELDHNGLSPLHLACKGGHVGVVAAIISHRPNLYMLKDCHSRIPLHCAVIEGDIAVILELRRCLEIVKFHNDGLEEVTDRGETAVHLALTSNQEGAFLALMDWLEPTTSEEEEGKLRRMEKLLCDVRDKTGHTVLELASSQRATMKKAVERISMYTEITVPRVTASINNPVGARDLVGSLEIAVVCTLLISELIKLNREDSILKDPISLLLGWSTLSSVVSATVLASLIFRLLPKRCSKPPSIYLLLMVPALSPIKRGEALIKLALLVLAGMNLCSHFRLGFITTSSST